MNDSDKYIKLKASIPTKTRPGKGGSVQTYVPVENVIERINEVLGLNWSFEILREGFKDGEVWAVVRIHYPICLIVLLHFVKKCC